MLIVTDLSDSFRNTGHMLLKRLWPEREGSNKRIRRGNNWGGTEKGQEERVHNREKGTVCV